MKLSGTVANFSSPSTPRSRSRICGPFGDPPKMQVLRDIGLTNDPNSLATDWICWASSRVGASTSTIGPSPRDSGRWLLMCTSPGSMYASVLPEPVMAMPSRSRPDSAMGQPCAWIGVGVTKPCLESSLRIAGEKFASLKS